MESSWTKDWIRCLVLIVQFSRSVVSDSLRPRGLQHARHVSPSLTPRAYSGSCASSRWGHPAVPSSVVPVSSCPRSLPAPCVLCLVAQTCLTLVTPWTVAHQAPLSMGFSRQEYWSGLPFPSREIFLTQESNPGLLHCRQTLYWLSYQDLFQWVSSSHQVAKVLELQHQSFRWIFRTDFLYDWLVGPPCSLRDSQESSPTPQFKSINS